MGYWLPLGIHRLYYQAVFAALLLLNVPIFWYKHRWDRIMDTRVIKEMVVVEPFRSESQAGLHHF